VKPILFVLTLPITVLTLGLFLIVLNAIMLKLTAAIVPGFAIEGFGWALLGAIFLAIVSTITNAIGPSKEDKR
jgi:putative membrane protein